MPEGYRYESLAWSGTEYLVCCAVWPVLVNPDGSSVILPFTLRLGGIAVWDGERFMIGKGPATRVRGSRLAILGNYPAGGAVPEGIALGFLSPRRRAVGSP